jgi:Spy/CpxP family protein refolding chaperone
MKKLTTILLIVTFIAAMSLTTMAKMHGRSHYKGECSEKYQHMKYKFWKKLNLTDEQKSEFEKLHKSHMDQMKNIHNEMKQYHEKLWALVKADKPDKDAIDKLIEEKAGKHIKWQKVHIDHMIKVRSLLNEEQKKLWDSHMGMFAHMWGHSKESKGYGDSGCAMEKGKKKRIDK